MQTGDISKIQRGKHTTRHVELFKVEDGYIADTPGFSTFDVLSIEPEDIANYYEEFENAVPCDFLDCTHVKEEECSIKKQVGKTIDQGRYERYCNIYNEQLEKKKNKY